VTFAARFAGVCPDCGERIHPGDVVTWADGATVHAVCPDTPDDRDAKRPVCPRCFLLEPCDCE
jgi:hypothetical protein